MVSALEQIAKSYLSQQSKDLKRKKQSPYELHEVVINPLIKALAMFPAFPFK